MSKTIIDQWDSTPAPDEPIPTYEESLTTSSVPTFPGSKYTSVPSMIRQERTRRIVQLVQTTLIPSFTLHLSNACTHLTIIILPSDALQHGTGISEQNVVTPSLPSHETTGIVAALTGDENRASFWTQPVVVQELDAVLRRELSCSSIPVHTVPVAGAGEDTKAQPRTQLLTPFQVQPAPSATLPSRPRQKSWLKRTFVLPGPEHDPTGETGKWDLGWRSAEQQPGVDDGGGATRSRTRTRTLGLGPDEVAVHTRLQEVSFRTESEMGLLETSTVKCVWLEIEIGT